MNKPDIKGEDYQRLLYLQEGSVVSDVRLLAKVLREVFDRLCIAVDVINKDALTKEIDKEVDTVFGEGFFGAREIKGEVASVGVTRVSINVGLTNEERRLAMRCLEVYAARHNVDVTWPKEDAGDLEDGGVT